MFFALRSRRAHTALPLLFFVIAVTLPGCTAQPVSETLFSMDTVITVTAYGPRAKAAVAEAVRVFDHVDTLMSAYRNTSDVARVNRLAGSGWVTVSSETFSVLTSALAMARQSGGAFDPTIGPLVRLWGIGARKNPAVPRPDAIRSAMSKVSYRRVKVDPVARRVFLEEPGMALDLGGVAKGYAAGKAAEVLRRHGVKHGLIDAGGNIVAVGQHPEGRPWNVGIRNPRNTGAVLGMVTVSNMAVVTSGDYERYFILNGRRYHHILDPRTGYPAQGMRSVTIIAPSSMQADLMSTAVFVLGPERGLRFAGRFEVDALIVDSSGGLRTTPGFFARYHWQPGQ